MKAIFINRDGAICRNWKDHVKSRVELEFLPGARQSLAQLAALDMPIVVIANHGTVSAQTVGHTHQKMMKEIEKIGGRVDRVLYCPHRPDENYTCCQPQLHPFWQIAREMGIDLTQSYLISDAYADLAAGEEVGCHCFLVLTPHGHDVMRQCLLDGKNRLVVASDLESVANAILREEGIT